MNIPEYSYELEYDLDFGMRWERRIHKWIFDKKMDIEATERFIAAKLNLNGINRSAITWRRVRLYQAADEA